MGHSFSDVNLTGGSAHTYTVAAIDGKSNASAQTSSASNTATAPVRSTSYTYDLADRLTGISPATGSASTLTFDALGRHLTKVTGGVTDTYSYAGESPITVRVAPSTGTRTNAVVDAMGSRLAINTSAGGFAWSLADLHGDVAGYAASSGATVTDATRYDPYGEVVANVSSGLPSPWGYQGRLDLAGSGDSDLLDFGFRPYSPDLGVFTSPDDLAGSALNPITFARYLYAGASPETLVDPDGHCFILCAVVGAVFGGVASAVGDIASGQGLNLQHIASGTVGGAAAGAVFGATGNLALAGAAGGAAAAATTEAWDWVASGGKDQFDVGAVGISGVAGLAAGATFGAVAGGAGIGRVLVGAAASGLVGDGVVQVAGVLTGKQPGINTDELLLSAALAATAAGALIAGQAAVGRLSSRYGEDPRVEPASKADFVVTPDGISIPTSRNALERGFDRAGFSSRPNAQTDEPGKVWTQPRTGTQYRVMSGRPRLTIHDAGPPGVRTPNRLLPGVKLPANYSSAQFRRNSHLPLRS